MPDMLATDPAALPATALDGTAARTCHTCKKDIVTSVCVEERNGRWNETTFGKYWCVKCFQNNRFMYIPRDAEPPLIWASFKGNLRFQIGGRACWTNHVMQASLGKEYTEGSGSLGSSSSSGSPSSSLGVGSQPVVCRCRLCRGRRRPSTSLRRRLPVFRDQRLAERKTPLPIWVVEPTLACLLSFLSGKQRAKVACASWFVNQGYEDSRSQKSSLECDGSPFTESYSSLGEDDSVTRVC